ncbi:zinc-dependent alcohol dehydrogenase family protein [Nonomuraea zeae]|uniref:Probable alcohol dehydrogenase AdhA n=1 Tax=Nonomuraea zeae TaxID=1642303 RepID=A0A5S4G0B1_9ACTN|nr:zinc-dependent alcohol dehydrogenase family protein [Nonomuraea zeae]TMR26487.1 zinc-dependent alcohol dehydrogenase family protein [Nonomuraea zeae]
MRAWVVAEPGPMASGPLELVERDVPEPGPGEVLVRVEACGVCRTDLHLAEGDLAPRRPRTTPGHQVVGRIERRGEGAGEGTGEGTGQRVGVAWLRSTCGTCRYCRRGMENLCPASTYTGWDTDGGYAEYLLARADYVYPLPGDVPAERLAPLLCAGIIGYRALARCDLPPGGRLGIYGFGASAHLTAQAAIAQGAVVHAVTRSAASRALALELGAASAGDLPPEPLDSAILFAPVGDLVPPALEALDRGGTLAVAGIHLTDVPALNYERHLFQERTLRSVTANTRADGRAYLELALTHPPRVTTALYSFESAGQALADLAAGQVNGAAVLVMS